MEKKISARNSSAGQDILHVFDNYPVSCATAIGTGHKAKKKKKRKQRMKTGKASRFSLDLVIFNSCSVPKEKREKKRRKKKKRKKERKLHAWRFLLDTLSC